MTDDIHRSLGRLEGKLDMILSDQEKARQDRKTHYEKADAIERRLEETDRKLDAVTDRFNEAAPVISDIKRWKERFIGAQMLIAAVLLAIGGGITIVWKWVAVKLGLQ